MSRIYWDPSKGLELSRLCCFIIITTIPFIIVGNRWIASLWTATPHQQPALDYTELQDIVTPTQQQVVYHHPPSHLPQHPQEEYLELKKKESDI